MTLERRERLAEELSTALRGLEDQSIRRIQAIFMASLRTTSKRLYGTLERIANQPEYDPDETPGAFLGSTPDGVVDITPETKNAAALYLQGQLVQDLRRVLDNMQLSPAQQARLDQELTDLFNQAQDLSTEYGLQMIREALQQPLAGLRRPAPGGELPPAPDGGPPPLAPYQEGQRFTRLLDIAGAVEAAERDFKSLADNYAMQRDMATSGHVAAAKAYYEKWWRHWGDTVSFMVGREMAAGPDPRRLKKALQERIPSINEAFRNRAETIARTETLIASGEAQERNWRQLRVGFVQYIATLDERVCEWCAPRAGSLYWVGGVKTPIHPNCVLGDTPVAPGSLIAATRGLYSGDVVSIAARSGHRLTCTENHLVLTEKGWIPARLLRKGMKVVSQPGEVAAAGAVPHLHQQPAPAKDVFEAAAAASPVPAGSVPAAPMHFHGDGRSLQGQIEVVWTDRELMEWLQAGGPEGGRHLNLQAADSQLPPPSGLGALDLRLLAVHAAASGLVGRVDLAAALLVGHLGPLQQLRFTAAAWSDPGFEEPPADDAAIDAQLLRELLLAHPGEIALDELIDVEVVAVHDVEVFDFTTASGAYLAGGVVTHNCRCALVPITLEGLAIENRLADEGETWEAQAQKLAADTRRHFEEVNGEGAKMRPTGGPGEGRGPRDFPLMERTRLPATRKRSVPVALDPAGKPWPSGSPVWCPRRGWLDPYAEATYRAITRQVAQL